MVAHTTGLKVNGLQEKDGSNIISKISKMRTTKELLQLTLDEGNKLHKTPKAQRKFWLTGLCGFVLFHLYDEKIINGKEFKVLSKFIEKNKPETTDENFYGTLDYLIGYYWPNGQWKPRKQWLEDQIKSL